MTLEIGQARVSSVADSAVQYASTGWTEEAESRTWSYSSADAPTYIFSVNADMTGIISTNMKLRFKQSAGTYKYAGVTAVGAYSGGVTLITAYFGTDYDLDNEAITNVAYSGMKAPFGFPMNQEKWTVEVLDSVGFTQNTPTQNQWYDTGLAINVPIGSWKVEYQSDIGATYTGSTPNVFITLSDNTSSTSNTNLSSMAQAQGTINAPVYRWDTYNLLVKDTLYLIIQTNRTSLTNIRIEGYTIIRAVWAGL